MELLFAIAFLLVLGVIIFVVEYWWLLLMFVGSLFLALIFALIGWKCELNRLKKNVALTRVIDEEPITKRVAENTGYSIGYGRHLSSREYYRYKNATTGYKIKFDVLFKDGKRKIIECNEGSAKYNILISKTLKIRQKP